MADKNISNKVFQYIKEKIIDKTWKPGDKITSEIQLAEELQVSRISVREAISKLVAMNVLITKKGGGSFVNSFSTTDYMDELIPFLMIGDINYIEILELRIAIESLAVKLFIERANKDDFDKLKICFNEMLENSENDDIFFEKDIEFHRIISMGSKNPIIEKIENILFKTMEGPSKREYHQLSAKERIEEHKKIIDFIEAKDKQLAMIYLERHLQRTIDDLKK